MGTIKASWIWIKSNAAGLFVAVFAALVTSFLVGAYYLQIRHVFYAVAHRVTAANLPLVLSAIAWPMVVALTAFLFRGPIRDFIAKMTLKLSVGDKTAEFSTGFPPEGEKSAPPPPVHGFADKIKTMPANVFWVGSDLVYLFDLLQHGGPRARIVELYRQANHHMKMLGLKDTPLHQRFMKLYTEAQASLEADWTNARRSRDLREAAAVRADIAALIESSQQNFSGDAKTSDAL